MLLTGPTMLSDHLGKTRNTLCVLTCLLLHRNSGLVTGSVSRRALLLTRPVTGSMSRRVTLLLATGSAAWFAMRRKLSLFFILFFSFLFLFSSIYGTAYGLSVSSKKRSWNLAIYIRIRTYGSKISKQCGRRTKSNDHRKIVTSLLVVHKIPLNSSIAIYVVRSALVTLSTRWSFLLKARFAICYPRTSSFIDFVSILLINLYISWYLFKFV